MGEQGELKVRIKDLVIAFSWPESLLDFPLPFFKKKTVHIYGVQYIHMCHYTYVSYTYHYILCTYMYHYILYSFM